jgi:hypothetical protein
LRPRRTVDEGFSRLPEIRPLPKGGDIKDNLVDRGLCRKMQASLLQVTPLARCSDAVLAKAVSRGSILHPMARRMLDLLRDDGAFRRHVFAAVDGQRKKLKLPPFDRNSLI